MTRLLGMILFLAGCQGPATPPPVEATAVEVGRECAALCAQVQPEQNPGPRSAARKLGDACLCFDPLKAAGTGRPLMAPSGGGKQKSKKSKRKKQDRR